MNDRIFLDTSYVQALLDRHDQYHLQAVSLTPLVQTATEIWITEAILIEIADALSAINRSAAIGFIDRCFSDSKVTVVNVNSVIFQQAKELYLARPDKTWGLTDCISFVVMQNENLIIALTSDRHFVQAGFRALMLETP